MYKQGYGINFINEQILDVPLWLLLCRGKPNLRSNIRKLITSYKKGFVNT